MCTNDWVDIVGRVKGSGCSGSLAFYFFSVGGDAVNGYVDLSDDINKMILNVGIFKCGDGIGNGFNIIDGDTLVSTSDISIGDGDEKDGEDIGKGIDVFIDIAHEDREVG